MAIFPRGKIWWYKFYFAGQLIRESSKSTSKTVAKNARKSEKAGTRAGLQQRSDEAEDPHPAIAGRGRGLPRGLQAAFSRRDLRRIRNRSRRAPPRREAPDRYR